MSDKFDNKPKGLTEIEVAGVGLRLIALGLIPTSNICMLPSNFFYAKNQGELFVAPAAADLRICFRQASVALDKIEPEGQKIPYRDDRDSTLILPLIFVGSAFLANNPHLLNVALGVISNYVTDYFRGKTAVKPREMYCIGWKIR